MAITSSDEKFGSRLADLEKRFDMFVAQDKPGSQQFTIGTVPYAGSNGALKSSNRLKFIDFSTNTAVRTGDVGSELIIENDGTGGIRYAGLRFRAVDTAVTVRSTGRILSTFLAGFFPDSALIFQTVSGAETFQDVMTLRGVNVGIGTVDPKAQLDVTNGYFRALDNGTNNAPGAGNGLEIIATGGTSYIQSYNRTTAAYQPIRIDGSTILFNQGDVSIKTGVAASATLEIARGTAGGGTLVARGTTNHTHFNFSTTEDTYIRGGKSTSKVFINDANPGIGVCVGGTAGIRDFNINSTTHHYIAFIRSSTEKFLIGYENLTPERLVIYDVANGTYPFVIANTRNIGFFSPPPTSNGTHTLFITNTTLAPSANPTGGGFLYVESGSLKYRGSSGNVTTLAGP